MKKYLIGLLVALPLTASAAATKNTVSMVTYFPVPYVAYSNVSVAKQMDIGLTNQACNLTLGCSTLASAPLEVTTTNVQSGVLSLDSNGYIRSTGMITLGSGNGPARLLFGRGLTVNSVSNATSIYAKDVYADTLNLFGKTFPACNVTNNQIAWTRLSLGPQRNKKELYLTCGPVPEDCSESARDELIANSKTNCTLQDVPDGRELAFAVGGSGSMISWIDDPTGEVSSQSVCGKKTRTYECNPAPTWTPSGWNTDDCVYFYPQVRNDPVRLPNCSTLCHSVASATVTGVPYIHKQQRCDSVNGGVFDYGATIYDLSACTSTEPSDKWCYSGTYTRHFTWNGSACEKGDRSADSDSYWIWVRTGSATVYTNCNCASVDCRNHSDCKRNFSSQAAAGEYPCGPTNEGNSITGAPSGCNFDQTANSWKCTASKYKCSSRSGVYALNSDGSCKGIL